MTEEETIAKLIALDQQIQLLSAIVREFVNELREGIDSRRDDVLGS